MSGTSTVRSTPCAVVNATRILSASCQASFALALALLVASAWSLWFEPGEVLRVVRTAMLQVGIPLVSATLAVAAVTARRVARATEVREALRLRERLYFVATMMLTVLAPSALLGIRTMLALRPGSMIVNIVEAFAWLLAAWLLWGSIDDARRLAVGSPDQPDDARAPERSMSSIL